MSVRAGRIQAVEEAVVQCVDPVPFHCHASGGTGVGVKRAGRNRAALLLVTALWGSVSCPLQRLGGVREKLMARNRGPTGN